MNFRDLTYLVALADHGHFGKAADACFVSQPSLSIQLKKLETTLGVTLIERSTKAVLLTETGRHVVKQARIILEQQRQLKTMAKRGQDVMSGDLTMGVIPSLTAYLLPHLVPEMTKTESFPKLSVYLSEHHTDQLINQVRDAALDTAFIATRPINNELVATPLFDEDIMLAVSNHHPLSKKKHASLTALKNDKMLVMANNDYLHDQAMTLCRNHDIPISTHVHGTSLEILRYMVASNVGVTIMPRLACIPTKGITYLSFNTIKIQRTIHMIWRKTTSRTVLFEKVAGHIRRLLANTPGIRVDQQS